MNTSAQLPTLLRSANESVLIDREMLLDRVGGDEELLREITTIFLEEYPTLIHEIEEAVIEDDSKRLEEAAHSLKGSIANFGAPAATQSAYRLETLGRGGNTREAAEALQELLSQFKQILPALERLAA